MVSGEFLDRIDERLRTIRGQPDRPFGGVKLLAIADFLKLPPVSQVSARHQSRKGFCPALFMNRGYAFQSRVWAELKIDTDIFNTTINFSVGRVQRTLFEAIHLIF